MMPDTKNVVTFPSVLKMAITFIVISTTIILASATALSRTRHAPVAFTTDSNPLALQTCGRSIAEARSHGCHFDIMSFSWLPTACFDEPLIAEFLSRKDWKWYSTLPANDTDDAALETVPLQLVQSGEYERLYVTWEYHLYHCTYMWRKLHRAIMNEAKVDEYIGSYGHTEHCEQMLLQRGGDLSRTNTAIVRKFSSCRGTGNLKA